MQIYNLGSRIVNAYLIPEKDGYVLIDTGYEDGGIYRAGAEEVCRRREKLIGSEFQVHFRLTIT